MPVRPDAALWTHLLRFGTYVGLVERRWLPSNSFRIAILSSAPSLLPHSALIGLAILAQAFLSQQRLETAIQSVCKTCTCAHDRGLSVLRGGLICPR